MNIYADRSFLPATISHTPLLYPYWGFQPPLGDVGLERHGFEHYVEQGAGLFNLTGLKESRIAVLPFNWEQIVDYDFYHSVQDIPADPEASAQAMRKAEELAALSESENRELVVFFSYDSIAEVPLGNSRVFRTSIERGVRRPHEYVMPFWMPDEVEATFGGDLPLREKGGRPVVGFCGFNPVELDARTRIRHGLGKLRGVRGIAYRLGVRPAPNDPFYARAEAIEAVSRSNVVQSNIILRDAWFNGVFEGDRVDRPLLQQSRRQYVENMFGSDYVLCTRGRGNYSIRFYETLSSGRIPVFVNTDCVLPFEEWIDWKQYCVWVEEADISRLPEMVAEFHEGLSAGEFKDRQRACRRLWEEWLSPFGFFKNLRRYFQ